MKSKSYIGNRYNRVKLYKKGKFWVASSITFLSLGIGAGANTVHATNVSSSSRNEYAAISTSREESSASSIKLQSKLISSHVVEAKADQSSVANSSLNSSQTKVESSISNSVRSSSSGKASVSSKQLSSNKQESTLNSRTSSVHSSEASSRVKKSSSSVETSSLSVNRRSSETPLVNASEDDKALSSNFTNSESSALNVSDEAKLIQDTPVITNRKNDEEDQADDNNTNLKVSAKNQIDPRSGELNLAVNYSSYGDWTIYFVSTSGDTIHASEGYNNMYGYQVEDDLETTVNTIENEGYQYVTNLPVTLTYPDGTVNAYYTLVFKQAARKQGQPVTVKYVTNNGKVLGTGTASYTSPTGSTDSTPYIGDTYSTTSETFKGYHLVKTPSNSTGSVTASAQTVTYTYAPDVQTITVNYIDPSEGTIVDIDSVKVSYGSSVNYSAQNYVDENLDGYEITKSDLPSNGILSYGTTTSYSVYLVHKISTTTQTSTYTQTIKYQYANGQQAEPTKTTTVTYTRTVETDEVTGKQTIGNWTTTDSTDLPTVTSPTISGYTPNQASVPAVTATPGESDNQTVIYNPNPESMTITYYDADENKVLATKTLQGGYGTSPDYDYQSVISQYEQEGYKVERSTIPSTGLVFTNSGSQSYEVDLTHTSTVLPADAPNLTETIKHTIRLYLFRWNSSFTKRYSNNYVYTNCD